MNAKIKGLVALLFCALAEVTMAEGVIYAPLSITNGYNVDIVANSKTRDANQVLTTTSWLDIPNAWAYYDSGVQTGGALPADGKITSPSGAEYVLSDYTKANALRIGSRQYGINKGWSPDQYHQEKGTLEFDNATAGFSQLAFLNAGGNGGIWFNAIVTYTDNSVETNANRRIYDWCGAFGNNEGRIYHCGRIQVKRDTGSEIDWPGATGKNCPGMFETRIDVDPKKTVKSVTFEYVGSARDNYEAKEKVVNSSDGCIFAVSGVFPVDVLKLTAADVTSCYDGEAHSIDISVIPETNKWTDAETEVRFRPDGSATWSAWTNFSQSDSVNPGFTNCCAQKVYVQARNLPHYTNSVEGAWIEAYATVTITQRVLKVTATDASKTYGGDDPTFAWTLSGDVLAKERGTVYQNLSNSASIVRADYPAGKMNKAGTYTDVLGSNGVFSATRNYKVEFEPGDFTINPAELTLTAKAYSGVYDGEGHTIGLEINVTNDTSVTGGGGSRICIRTSIDNITWSEWEPWPADVEDILPKATNVDDTVMTVYVQATNEWAVTGAFSTDYSPDAVGNYRPTATNATVTITKRPITLTTSSVNVTVPYGEIATFGEDKIKDAATLTPSEGLGYVSGEKFTYSNLATNRNEGTTIGATFDYAANTTIIENNYTVSRTYGKLTVQSQPSTCISPLCCEDVEPENGKCFAWVLRATVRTLVPAKVTVAAVPAAGGTLCADGYGASAATNCNYLVAGVRKFVGLAWRCNSVCPAGDIAAGNVQYVLWEDSSKLPVSSPLVVTASPNEKGTGYVNHYSSASVLPAADGVATLFDRFGLYGTAAEMYYELPLPGFTLGGMTASEQAVHAGYAGVFAGTLKLAGFGALPSRLPAANFQTVNGYCVANWRPECGPTKKDFCSKLLSWCTEVDATNVAGYGVWSMSYSELYSSGKYSLGQIVPARSQIRAE